MLVELLVGGREHDAMLPVDAQIVLILVEPEQRIAMAGHAHHVEARTMAMALLVGAHRHFRDMGVHGAIGQHEHDVGATRAPITPGLQLDGRQIGNEIRLPHVVARAHRDQVAFAAVVAALARALREVEGRLEDEFLVVEGVHHQRQVGGGDEQGALAAAGVEVAMLGVQRNGEEALGAPFEAALRAVSHFDLGRAGALQHVIDVLIEMALGLGGAARRQVQQEHVAEVAAALQMHGGALDAKARPHLRLDREEVDAIVLGDGDAFLGDPVEIGVYAVAGGGGFAHGCFLAFMKTAVT